MVICVQEESKADSGDSEKKCTCVREHEVKTTDKPWWSNHILVARKTYGQALCPYTVGNKVRTHVLATQGGPLKVSRAVKIMFAKEEVVFKRHGHHLLTLCPGSFLAFILRDRIINPHLVIMHKTH